ncbi:MAG: hypothetical protein HZC41_12495 [Chloroflexi bacterium]|nr:hypothetical protein [Chloroflexota bacterium]
MSIEGLIVSLVIVLATVLWIVSPFWQRQVGSAASDAIIQKQHERLLVYYERVLTNIRDLDEDYSTGKMQAGDYETEREEWVQRGVQVLKALDELDQHRLIVPDADQEALDHAIDDAIEQAIATHRRTAH